MDQEHGLHSVWKVPRLIWPAPPSPLPDAVCVQQPSPVPGVGLLAHPPQAPALDCTCGYYACWSQGAKADEYYLSHAVADFPGIAVVGTGLLIPHEWGFRAAKLRVLAVIAPDHLIEPDDHKRLMSIADRYGVPLVRRSGLHMLAEEHDLEVRPWTLASQSDSP